MSGFAPKFCPTHLQIHVCELQNVFEKNKTIEDDLSAKVRRLHGTQTEEELAKEQSKRKNKKGTLGDILAKAKKKIKAEKKALAKNDVENKTPPSEEEIGDRMAALRAKMNQTPSSSPTSNNSQISNVEETGLENIIKNAKNHQKDNPQENFKAPQRAKTGEKQDNTTSKDNKPYKVSKDLKLNNTKVKNIALEKNGEKEEINSTKKETSVKIFSKEEAEELIQIAVKEALKQVGILEKLEPNNKEKKSTSVKKITTNSRNRTNLKKDSSNSKTKSNSTVKNIQK